MLLWGKKSPNNFFQGAQGSVLQHPLNLLCVETKTKLMFESRMSYLHNFVLESHCDSYTCNVWSCLVGKDRGSCTDWDCSDPLTRRKQTKNRLIYEININNMTPIDLYNEEESELLLISHKHFLRTWAQHSNCLTFCRSVLLCHWIESNTLQFAQILFAFYSVSSNTFETLVVFLLV